MKKKLLLAWVCGVLDDIYYIADAFSSQIMMCAYILTVINTNYQDYEMNIFEVPLDASPLLPIVNCNWLLNYLFIFILFFSFIKINFCMQSRKNDGTWKISVKLFQNWFILKWLMTCFQSTYFIHIRICIDGMWHQLSDYITLLLQKYTWNYICVWSGVEIYVHMGLLYTTLCVTCVLVLEKYTRNIILDSSKYFMAKFEFAIYLRDAKFNLTCKLVIFSVTKHTYIWIYIRSKTNIIKPTFQLFHIMWCLRYNNNMKLLFLHIVHIF